jgi:hypothetical protein
VEKIKQLLEVGLMLVSEMFARMPSGVLLSSQPF